MAELSGKTFLATLYSSTLVQTEGSDNVLICVTRLIFELWNFEYFKSLIYG